MNWEALGAIGEIVGAMAVVLTLGYLAMQIRQNTRSLRLSTHHTIASRVTDMLRSYADSADLARITETGDRDPNELSPEDRRRWRAWNLGIFRHLEDMYYQYSNGMLDESYWTGFRRWRASRLREPGVVSFWDENKGAFRGEFITFVDSLVEKNRERANE
jgi:hypothetical protein